MDCKKCNCSVTTEESLKCLTCHDSYHYHCANLSETEFKKILPMNKMKWKCLSCKAVKKKISPIASRSEPSPAPLPVPVNTNIDANTIMEHLDTRFWALKSSIESLRVDVNDQLKNLSDLVSSWEAKINNFSSSITMLNSQIVELTEENESLKSELATLDNRVKLISASNDQNEQWVRRSNIQINGVPQKNGENLLTLIRSLAQKSNFTLDLSNDIDFVTRVAVKNDTDNKTPKPIILKMQSRYKKDDFLSSLRRLNKCTALDLGITGAQSGYKIFFNDHLSAKNKYLLKEAKRRCKEKGYTFCWVRNCTIMVRRNEKSRTIYINSEESLNNIV